MEKTPGRLKVEKGRSVENLGKVTAHPDRQASRRVRNGRVRRANQRLQTRWRRPTWVCQGFQLHPGPHNPTERGSSRRWSFVALNSWKKPPEDEEEGVGTKTSTLGPS